MRTLSNTLLIIATGFIITAIGCKKDDKNVKQDVEDCIELIFPVVNTVPVQNVQFEWSSCEEGPYRFILFLDSVVKYDSIVNSKSFFINDLLVSGASYRWVVSTGNTVSDTAIFTIQAVDSFIVGNYLMHKIHYSSSPFTATTTDYGFERVSIVSAGSNQLNVNDSTGSNNIMTVSYGQSFNAMSDYYSRDRVLFFGTWPYEDHVLYNMNNDTVTVMEMIHYGVSGQTYYKWKGVRIP